jgi:hypothetical protein
MSKRTSLAIAAAIVSVFAFAGLVFAAVIDPVNRTVTTTQFFLDWHATDPEEILYVRWNGSGNLTNTAQVGTTCTDDLEYFGNAWVTQDEGTPAQVFVSLVGWGTTGNWQAQGSNGVKIGSSSNGCFGSAGLRVQTKYRFPDRRDAQNRFRMVRKFHMGNTPFDYDFRPYIARLTPRAAYSDVLHPDAAGTTLLTEDSMLCDFGCRVDDWNQQWFAVHNPATGEGMIVKRGRAAPPAALWVDQDSLSDTSSSSALLLKPGGGFTGTVKEVETFCFYNSVMWTPSLTLPPGC